MSVSLRAGRNLAVLHTAAPLQSFVGATLLSRLPLVTAHNLLLLLIALTAHRLMTYTLAFLHTRRAAAAVLAGHCVELELYRHPLTRARQPRERVGLPLGALVIAFLIAPSALRGALVGVTFAITAYSDYYYLIYLGVFAALVVRALPERSCCWREGDTGPSKALSWHS